MIDLKKKIIKVLITLIISTTSFSALAHDEINLKGKFQNIDANNDETISLEEFKNFVLENRRMNRLERIFNRIDNNSNGEITIEELELFQKKFREKQKS
jgi:hypothetical protein